MPTKLDREEFYRLFAAQLWRTMPSTKKALRVKHLLKRSGFWWSVLPNVPRFLYASHRHRKVFSDPRSYLNDEAGVLDGKARTHLRRIVPVTQIEGDSANETRDEPSLGRLPIHQGA